MQLQSTFCPNSLVKYAQYSTQNEPLPGLYRQIPLVDLQAKRPMTLVCCTTPTTSLCLSESPHLLNVYARAFGLANALSPLWLANRELNQAYAIFEAA